MWILIIIKKDFIYIFLFMFINFNIYLMESYANFKINQNLVDKICCICLIVFYLIEKLKEKHYGQNYETSKILSYKIIIFIILSIILHCLSEYKFYNEKDNEMEEYVFIILFLILLEIIIFKKTFYIHQIISFIILIILFIFILFQIYMKSKIKLSSYPLNILQNYSYSLCLHLIKYINTQYFINIYLLASINAIPVLFIILFQNTKYLFPFNGLNNNFMIILYFLLYLINNFLRYKIIDKLSPLHSYISDFISFFFLNKILDLNLLYIGFGLLLIISCLIYLEILELNFCDLNKNTLNNIGKRGEKEIINQLSDSTYESNYFNFSF